MRRREFIGGLSGAAIALPLAVRAQPSERIRRIGVLMNLASDDREGQSRFALFRRSLQDIGWVGLIGIDLAAIDVRDAAEIDRAVAEFSRGGPNDGLIVTASQFSSNHPEAIVAVAATHKLPAVYPFSFFVRAGGLISYGPDLATQYGVAAGYVDRILKGEKPAELPVQVPTKYDLIINLKTAKALGIDLPPSLLARADEVIE